MNKKPHVFDPAHLHKLDNPDRLKSLPPKSTLIDLGLVSGNIFLDYGAGAGYFSFAAADIVGEKGKLIAADISQEMIDVLTKRAFDHNLNDIVTIKLDGNVLDLPNNSVDFIMLSFVLHEIDDKPSLLNELKRVLKPGGKLAIIEWQNKETLIGPPLIDRLSEENVKDTITALGYNITKSNEINSLHYYVLANINH